MAPSFVASEEEVVDMIDVDTNSENFTPFAVDPNQSGCIQPQSSMALKIDSVQVPIEVCPSDHLSVSAQGKKGELCSTPHRKNRGRSSSHKGRTYSEKSTSGRWTATEHNAFLRGLQIFGREWKKVVTCIPTRTSAQIRSHAQKYFAKQSKEMQQFNTWDKNIRAPCLHGTSSKSDLNEYVADHTMSNQFNEVMKSITNDPVSIEIRVCATLASLRERYKALEERLRVVRAPPLCELQVQSDNAAVGPATAALEQEQKSLRKAAEARYEIKKRQLQRAKQQATPEVETTSCALVSLASMRSYGGFDSNDVIALSMLGGNLGKESITWNTARSRSGHE